MKRILRIMSDVGELQQVDEADYIIELMDSMVTLSIEYLNHKGKNVKTVYYTEIDMSPITESDT